MRLRNQKHQNDGGKESQRTNKNTCTSFDAIQSTSYDAIQSTSYYAILAQATMQYNARYIKGLFRYSVAKYGDTNSKVIEHELLFCILRLVCILMNFLSAETY